MKLWRQKASYRLPRVGVRVRTNYTQVGGTLGANWNLKVAHTLYPSLRSQYGSIMQRGIASRVLKTAALPLLFYVSPLSLSLC